MSSLSDEVSQKLSLPLQVISDRLIAWQLQAEEYKKGYQFTYQNLLPSSSAFKSQVSTLYQFQNLQGNSIAFTLKPTSVDGNCFFHAVNIPDFNRNALITKLLENAIDKTVLSFFAYEIRQFLYLGYTGSHSNKQENEACQQLLTENIKGLFFDLKEAEENLTLKVGEARSELGTAETHWKLPEELLALLRHRNSNLVVEFEQAYQSILNIDKAIYQHCCQENIFKRYVELYLRDANGYIPFSRDFGTETPATTIDVINQLFQLKIQVYLPCKTNQPQSGETVPIFHNGINHFWGLTKVFPSYSNNSSNVQQENSSRRNVETRAVASPCVAPQPSKFFLGREVELKDIFDRLKEKMTVVITGTGGIGKTQTALSHAKVHINNYPGGTWFLKADTVGELKVSFEYLAEKLGIKKTVISNFKNGELIERVKSELQNYPRSLFIFDGASCYSEIEDYLLSSELEKDKAYNLSHHRELITSRNQSMADWNPSDVVKLPLFTIEESTKYIYNTLRILKNFHQEAEKNVQELALTLGYLPLALAIAVKVIGYRSSINEYLYNFNENLKKRKELFGQSIFVQDGYKYKSTILNVWELSIEQIEKNHPELAQKAIDFLKYCAYLNSNIIKLWVFKNLLGDDLKKVIDILCDASLAELINDDELYVHTLLQEVMIIRNLDKNNNILVVNKLFLLLIKEFEDPNNCMETDRSFLRIKILYMYFKNVVNYCIEYEIIKNVGNAIGFLANAWWLWGNIDEVYSYFNCEKIKKIIKGSLPNIQAEIYNCLGDVCNDKGYTQEAIDSYLKPTLKISEVPKNNCDALLAASVRVNLASAYRDLYPKKPDHLEVALKYIDEAIEILQKNRIHIKFQNELVKAYISKGNLLRLMKVYSKSLFYNEEALRELEKIYKGDHPRKSTILNNIGIIYYYNLGDYNEGLFFIKQAYEADKKLYGDSSFRTVRDLNNIADCLIRGEIDIKQGIKSAREAFEAYRCKDDKLYAAILNTLGIGYLRNKDYEQAIKYLRESNDLKEKLCEIDDEYYNAEEKLKEAKKSLIIQKNHYGKDHIEMLNILTKIDQHKETTIMSKLTEIQTCLKNGEGSPHKVFENLARHGLTWSIIKSECLYENYIEGSDDWRQRREIVRELIILRDRLDEELYSEAAAKLFPKEKDFHIKVNPEGVLSKDFKNDSVFKLEYYTLWIFDKAVSAKERNLKTIAHTTVIIKAPGSRDLSSDIDTTVSVQDIGQINLHKAQFPEDWKLDLAKVEQMSQNAKNALVQIALIHYFNELNNHHFRITSGESRDSNVYSDGFLNPLAYPKFKYFNDKLEAEEENIAKQYEPEGFYALYKETRQQYELAASLFSLREYFHEAKRDREWPIFQQELIRQFNLRYGSNSDPSLQAAFKKNIDTIFKFVDKWFIDKERDLKEVLEFKSTITLLSYPLTDEMSIKRDRKVAAMNQLYVQHLLIVAWKYQDFDKAKSDIDENLKELKKASETVQDNQVAINAIEGCLISIPNNTPLLECLKTLQINLAVANQLKKKFNDILLERFKDRAKIINEIQLEQIKANLFANEAYINRSAPYHVVEWQQSGQEDVRINKRQVVMGSILQQIGFRLLHAERLLNERVSVGEVLFQVSKYGLRVADMLFGEETKPFHNKPFTKLEVEQFRQSKSSEILRRLRSSQEKLGQNFQEDIYQLVNSDIALVREVSKNSQVLHYEKPEKAASLAKEFLYRREYPEQSTVSPHDIASISDERLKKDLDLQAQNWLEIARTVILLTYSSRLEDKQALWGGKEFKLSKNLLFSTNLSHLVIPLSERKLTMSSSNANEANIINQQNINQLPSTTSIKSSDSSVSTKIDGEANMNDKKKFILNKQ